MSLELLKPISENLLEELDENHLQGSLFNKIKLHRDQSGIPDIDSSNLCIIGISETRNSYFESDIQDLNILRKELYKLKQGKWKISISDLGLKIEKLFFLIFIRLISLESAMRI